MKYAPKTRIDAADLRAPELATLSRIAGYMAPYRSRAAGVFACMLVGAGLNLAPSWFIKRVVDSAIPRGDLRLLWLYCAGMVAAALVAGLLQVAQKYGAASIGQHVMLDLRVALYRHLHRMEFAFFATRKPGEAVSHVLNDVEGVGSVVSGTLVDVVQNTIVLTTTFAFVVFALDWRLALLASAFLPFFILPTRRVGRTRKALKRQVQATMAELTGMLTEMLSVSGALLVKVFDTEKSETERFRGKAETLTRLSLQQTLVGRWFQLLLGLFEAVAPAVVFALGGWLVIRGRMPLGTIVAFVTVMKRLYSPASQLAGVRVDLLTSYAYFERLFSVLDRTPAVCDAAGAVRLESAAGWIDIRSLSFAYGDCDLALRDVDVTIPPGTRVGLVGRSGAGKTTLASLVSRLYDPTSGAVLIDGIDVRRVTQASLRANIAVVTQETFLFHATVLDNLLYGCGSASRAEVECAARLAQIHDVIAALPEGYDTIVGERGYRFSAGERQRIAIARAILKNPRIIILDEATSALDSVSERLVHDALGPLLDGRTSLTIAHRLSTVRDADLILVFERGRIVERGTHDALVERGGLYARLWRAHTRRESRRRARRSPISLPDAARVALSPQ